MHTSVNSVSTFKNLPLTDRTDNCKLQMNGFYVLSHMRFLLPTKPTLGAGPFIVYPQHHMIRT